MSVWRLNIDGVESTMSDLGIAQFDLSMQNLGEDALKLDETPGSFNATPVIAYGQTVKLIEDSTTRFVGTAVSTPRAGLPGQIEQRSYTIKNMFWSLNRVIYEQDWHYDATNTYFKGRVILGKDVDDNRVTVGAAIKDILDFAVTEGLVFSYVQADLDALDAIPPDNTVVDVTCFEAIKSLLNWAPGVATSVDYTTGAPKLRFIQRASAAGVDFTATELRELFVTPRSDQKIDGVVINYELLNNAGGDTYTTAVQDTAGTSSGLNVLKQTIDLFGVNANSSSQKAKIMTAVLPEINAAFFTDRLPGLSQVTNLVVTPGTLPNTAATPRILMEGSVPEWTDKITAEVMFPATISGKINGVVFTDSPIAVTLVMTDAESKTYSQLTSVNYTAAEDVPEGLAAKVFAERSVLHYEGRFSLLSVEPDWSANTSNVCNIVPGGVDQSWDDAEDWSDTIAWLDTIDGFAGLDAINAVVESIRIVKTPSITTTAITIGPPRHLQVQDFIALARATRVRQTSSWTRKDPSNNDDIGVESSGGAPNTNGAMMSAGLPAGGTEGQHLEMEVTGPVWADIPDDLPPASTGDLLIGVGTTWTPTAAGAANTVLRSNATSPSYDLVIEDGTASGQIMVWDEAKGGIVAETLPSQESIVLQAANGDISHMINNGGTPALPIFTAAGNPQISGMPATAGFLYHDGNGGFSNGTAPVLPPASTGELLIGVGTTWTPTAAGAVNTVLRSSGSDVDYDLVIEDGTTSGQIMVWDDVKGGIVAESLPIGNDAIILQAADGDISYMQGTSSLPYFDSTGQPQAVSLPTGAGLLYYDGAGGFSSVTIPSGGLLTGGGTSFGSESYSLTSGYFTY